ncbi:hypothetical protein [Enterovibrio norvegicus]|uniref:hypothetical protein n=1 Tax=Enterovibrio norvegicus TaxID=188144 RepID=UPI000C827752|nr:hypothetical protein [Enterovibrio norvegicus]PML77273.1 hypothetical protein BCT69_19700 [Enterovibrio norvegicus]
MKKLTMALAVALLVSGCANKDIGDVVNDGVNGAINGVFGAVGGNGTVVKNDGGFSVEQESIYVTDGTRTSKDYGSILVTKTKKNPKGRTEVFIESCLHPRIGSLECEGTMWELTPEGWLVEDSIWLHDDRTATVAAGKYYFKMQSNETSTKYYATGEVTLVPFVTNYIALTVE